VTSKYESSHLITQFTIVTYVIKEEPLFLKKTWTCRTCSFDTHEETLIVYSAMILKRFVLHVSYVKKIFHRSFYIFTMFFSVQDLVLLNICYIKIFVVCILHWNQEL